MSVGQNLMQCTWIRFVFLPNPLWVCLIVQNVIESNNWLIGWFLWQPGTVLVASGSRCADWLMDTCVHFLYSSLPSCVLFHQLIKSAHRGRLPVSTCGSYSLRSVLIFDRNVLSFYTWGSSLAINSVSDANEFTSIFHPWFLILKKHYF